MKKQILLSVALLLGMASYNNRAVAAQNPMPTLENIKTQKDVFNLLHTKATVIIELEKELNLLIKSTDSKKEEKIRKNINSLLENSTVITTIVLELEASKTIKAKNSKKIAALKKSFAEVTALKEASLDKLAPKALALVAQLHTFVLDIRPTSVKVKAFLVQYKKTIAISLIAVSLIAIAGGTYLCWNTAFVKNLFSAKPVVTETPAQVICAEGFEACLAGSENCNNGCKAIVKETPAPTCNPGFEACLAGSEKCVEGCKEIVIGTCPATCIEGYRNCNTPSLTCVNCCEKETVTL